MFFERAEIYCSSWYQKQRNKIILYIDPEKIAGFTNAKRDQTQSRKYDQYDPAPNQRTLFSGKACRFRKGIFFDIAFPIVKK